MKKLLALIAFSVLLLAPVGAQNAFGIVTSGAVTGGTALTIDGGVFQKLTPPIGPVGDDNQQSSNLFAFDETQNVVIPAGGVTTDQCFIVVGICPIPAGTIVASHYVFFDPDPVRTQEGTVDFDSDVYAIISSTANLLASDFLITPNADYLNRVERGIEPVDSITKTGPQQIAVNWGASTPGDYIRVLTVFSPGGEEVCDGIDNDGDGGVDEDLICSQGGGKSSQGGGKSSAYQGPTIGVNNKGMLIVTCGLFFDGICYDITSKFHYEFKLYEMMSGLHTISVTSYCAQGVVKCNYVAIGIMPYSENMNNPTWKIELKKDHLGNLTPVIYDPEGFIGEVTITSQIVDGKFLLVSFTIEFKNKDTGPMKFVVEVRDNKNGRQITEFNEGVEIIDAHAYPYVETAFEEPLVVEPLCIGEDVFHRNTCAFDKVKEWATNNAEETLRQMLNNEYIYK